MNSTDSPQYSQVGTYTAIAGIVVSLLAHFGFNATVQDVVQVIGGVVVLYGIIHQAVKHHSLAKSAGAL